MVARQAPVSMEFSWEEHWSGLPFPPPGDLPSLGIKPGSLTLQADCLLNAGSYKFPLYFMSSTCSFGLPWWLSCKNPPGNVGDTCSIPGSGNSPGKENGSALQYSCLENPMDRGAWLATVQGITKESVTT